MTISFAYKLKKKINIWNASTRKVTSEFTGGKQISQFLDSQTAKGKYDFF
jgi:hypothetical protein